MSEVCLVKKFLWPYDFDPGSTVSALYCVEQLNGRFQRGPKQNDQEPTLSITSFIPKLYLEFNRLSTASTIIHSCACLVLEKNKTCTPDCSIQTLKPAAENPEFIQRRLLLWKQERNYMSRQVQTPGSSEQRNYCVQSANTKDSVRATYDNSPHRCCRGSHHLHHISTRSGRTLRSCIETARSHTLTACEFLCFEGNIF